MVMPRTLGRRFYEVRIMSWVGGLLGAIAIASSLWFLHGSFWRAKNYRHNPHYETAHCYDCHEQRGSKMTSEDCFDCHNRWTRQLLPGAVERRRSLSEIHPCLHPIKSDEEGSDRTVTKLCTMCHKNVGGFVAMVDINTKRYVEIDMSITHPVGLMPTETIYPRTLPLDKDTGSVNCISCHDPHATDKRLRMLRYYYPGNGRPADFRPLCLDCHHDGGWIPIRIDLGSAIKREGPHK